MKSISKIIVCCGLAMAVMQCAIAADSTKDPAPNQAAKKPTKVIVNKDQVRKRLEDKGIQAKKRSELAKKKSREQQGSGK